MLADAETAAVAAERLLHDPEGDARALAAWLGERPVLALLGRGESRAAAEMGALTLKEAARFPAESLQAAQFRHGPLELAGPELAVVIHASERATRDLDLGLAAELVAAGSAVLVTGPDGAAPAGAMGIATGEVSGRARLGRRDRPGAAALVVARAQPRPRAGHLYDRLQGDHP